MRDFYGNKTQTETPTTMLLRSHRDKREASDGLFRFGHKQYPDQSKASLVQLLNSVAKIVAETNVERFKVEILIEEV